MNVRETVGGADYVIARGHEMYCSFLVRLLPRAEAFIVDG